MRGVPADTSVQSSAGSTPELHVKMLAASGYQLLDTGNGAKLEQVGPYRLIRPAPQALWRPSSPPEVWDTAVARYQRSSAGGGAWTYKYKLPPTWVVYYCDLILKVRLTDFGHLGFFAEHGPHWQWLRQYLQASGRPIRLLNTFAYTGGMSLAAAAAGASVVHLDAADSIVTWARDNAQLSGLATARLRWRERPRRSWPSRRQSQRRRWRGCDAVWA